MADVLSRIDPMKFGLDRVPGKGREGRRKKGNEALLKSGKRSKKSDEGKEAAGGQEVTKEHGIGKKRHLDLYA